MAPAPYVPDKKWKVVWSYNTSITAQLDPEDRKYYQYQHVLDWMEKRALKSCQIRFLNGMNCIFGNSLGALGLSTIGSAFGDTDVLCVIKPIALQVCALSAAMVSSSWSAAVLMIRTATSVEQQ